MVAIGASLPAPLTAPAIIAISAASDDAIARENNAHYFERG